VAASPAAQLAADTSPEESDDEMKRAAAFHCLHIVPFGHHHHHHHHVNIKTLQLNYGCSLQRKYKILATTVVHFIHWTCPSVRYASLEHGELGLYQ